MPPRTRDACSKKRLRKIGKSSYKYQHTFNRGGMIQNEVITSHKKNVEIEWIWNDLEEKEDCEELSKVSSLLLYLRTK